MAKCAKLAKDKGYPGFAVYNHGAFLFTYIFVIQFHLTFDSFIWCINSTGMCLMAEDMFDQGVYNERGNKSAGHLYSILISFVIHGIHVQLRCGLCSG